MSNDVRRKKLRVRWCMVKSWLLVGLAILAIYQSLSIEHLKTNNANLTYQYLCSQQDLKSSTKELNKLLIDINEKQKTELITSRGAQRSVISLSEAEFTLVCRVVVAESSNQSVKGQQIVAQCIYDRLKSNCYGANVTEVVYAPGQFASPFQGDLRDYPSVTYAVYSVFILGKMPLAADVRVFFNPDTADQGAIKPLREKYTYITTEGNHEVRGYI